MHNAKLDNEPLPLAQQQLAIHGHALEARVYAEDPDKGFLPSTGKVLKLEWPQHFETVAGVAWVGVLLLVADAVIELATSPRPPVPGAFRLRSPPT